MAGQPIIVALDGPVASGKSSVGRRVAARLGLPFVDSGLVYRAISAAAVEAGLAPDDEVGTGDLAERTQIRINDKQVHIDGRDLSHLVYSEKIASHISKVSANPRVRAAVVDVLRQQVGQGVVMAGRDIGTVVFPHTPFKFFLIANEDARIQRRAEQFIRDGIDSGPAQTRAGDDVRKRDLADSTRSVSPLKPAEDAQFVDTNNKDIESLAEFIASSVDAKTRKKGLSLS